jgi:broad specificity phosphatase PhoE
VRALLCLLLFLCPLGASAQRAVFFVRHAEKVDESRDPHLSAAGKARAEALARLLRDAGVRAIYVSELQRTGETAAPLSKALGLQPVVAPRGDAKALAARVRREHPEDAVLIVGHGDTVPQLLRAFGHPREISIDKGEYDNLFLLVPRPQGAPVFLRLRY